MSLQDLRNASDKPLAKLLMGVLMFSFVGWGVASWVLEGGGISDALVKVGSESVTIREFEDERNRQMAQMSREMQRQIFTDRQTQGRFSQQILSNMATRMLLEQRAENIGLVVSPLMIANIIKNSPEFWDDGAFSTDKFDAVLAINGYSERFFTDMLRRQALREMMLDSMAMDLPVPDFMSNAVAFAREAQRKIEYTTVKFDQFRTTGTPTDDQLREVHARNPRVVPEHRTIHYIIVGAKMDQPDSFERGYESARSVEDMLAQGDAMQDAAKKMRVTFRALEPMTMQRRTTRGTVVNDPVLNDEIMQNLFRMEIGMESEIMESRNGFVIFRVMKVDAAHAAAFDDRKTELTNLWRRSEQEKQAYLAANEIVTDGKKLTTSATVGRATGAPLEVLNAAFAAEVGKPRIIPGEGAFHVVKVLENIQPEIPDARRKAMKTEIGNMLGRQILDDYTGFLQRRYRIVINEKLMRRMFDN